MTDTGINPIIVSIINNRAYKRKAKKGRVTIVVENELSNWFLFWLETQTVW